MRTIKGIRQKMEEVFMEHVEPDEKRCKPHHHIVGEGPKELVLLLVNLLTAVSQPFL
jgi:hypothetical protein